MCDAPLPHVLWQVENPIAFAPDVTTRALSTLHLHALYARLLLWPARLSADWSFACVPLVTRWSDPRNAASIALYFTLLAIVLLARPWGVLLDCARAARGSSATGCCGSSAGVVLARWRAAVMGGLLVAPFFPASNVLFYVGTFIGERLLYMPSVGFLLLLSELCLATGLAACVRAASAISWGVRRPRRQASACLRSDSSTAMNGSAAAVPGAGSGRGPDSAGVLGPGRGQRGVHSQGTGGGGCWKMRASRVCGVCGMVGAVLLTWGGVVLLAWYAGRTWGRNWEWANEEALFVSAQRVRSSEVWGGVLPWCGCASLRPCLVCRRLPAYLALPLPALPCLQTHPPLSRPWHAVSST